MKPTSYLNLLTNNWRIVEELFKAERNGLVDHNTLQDIISRFKGDDQSSDALREKLISKGIIGQPFTGESRYRLGLLAKTIAEELLHEQQLGLSEVIQVYVKKLDDVSGDLLDACTHYDSDKISTTCNLIFRYNQSVKQQINGNLQAIRNIVSEAKKKDTSKPLKQRYTDVIKAWDEYIEPMGDMIDLSGAFDSIIDSAVGRVDVAIKKLERAGALISEVSNLQNSRYMLSDLSAHILINFRQGRDLLKPLYEIARLNSRITRGVTTIIELVQKDRLNEIDDFVPVALYQKSKSHMVSNQSALMKAYFNYKNVKNAPPPTIPSAKAAKEKQSLKKPPIDIKIILSQLLHDAPQKDLLKWALENMDSPSTEEILLLIMHVYSDKRIHSITKEPVQHKNKTHLITGCRIQMEHINHVK